MKIIKIISVQNNLFVYLAVVIAANLFLLNLPLAGIFGYEFAAINSFLLVLLTSIYTIKVLKKNPLSEAISSSLNKIIITVSLFIAVPLITGLLHSFFGMACSVADGLLFYLVITVPSVIIGTSIGIMSYTLSRRFAVAISFILFFIIALIPVFEIYFFPQVYFYNPLIGFFPGTIYDEAMSVSYELIIYRVFNILYFGSAIYLLSSGSNISLRLNKKIVVFSYFIIALIFIYISPLLGYSTSENRLTSELNQRTETDHFIIYFAGNADTNLRKSVILHHEYYYDELSRFFKIRLNKKITSFVFGSSSSKGKLFGAENADVAKPWLMQIYTTQFNYNTTLKHELAHVFSGAFSNGIFKVAAGFNPALIEGVATAADPFYDENSINYLAAAAYNNGYRVSIRQLFELKGFFTTVSSLSYIYSGAFSKYLIDIYGIEKYKNVYVNQDFQSVYKKRLYQLENDFYNYLKSFDVAGTEHMAHYYFGRKSIFQKVCPRYVADQLKKASQFFENKDYNSSAKLFRHLYNISDSYTPLAGLVNCLIKLNNSEQADSILSSDIPKFQKTGYYYNLELRSGDVLALQDKYASAEEVYSRLILQAPGNNVVLPAEIRKALISKAGLLKKYITGNETDKYLILREVNTGSYNYSTFPALVELSRSLEEDYNLFLRQFTHTMEVTDYTSSYAVFTLSEYAAENMDITTAQRLAGLALRYNEDKNLVYLLDANLNKLNWFRSNSQQILSSIR